MLNSTGDVHASVDEDDLRFLEGDWVQASARSVFGTGEPGEECLLPELYKVGWSRFEHADPRHLPCHTHPGAIELSLIVDGEVEWEASGQPYILRAGDLFVTKADERHGGVDCTMHPCTLYWLNLGTPSSGCAWQSCAPDEAQEIEAAFAAFDTHRLRSNATIRAAFQALFIEHRQWRTVGRTDGFERRAAAAALNMLLIETIRLYRGTSGKQEQPDTALPQPIQRAMELLQRDLATVPSRSLLERAAGLTFTGLNREFVRHLGISIQDFRTRERIRQARHYLRNTDLNITDISFMLGFSSSQHFSTTFKRFTGWTPSQFRTRHAYQAVGRRRAEAPRLSRPAPRPRPRRTGLSVG